MANGVARGSCIVAAPDATRDRGVGLLGKAGADSIERVEQLRAKLLPQPLSRSARSGRGLQRLGSNRPHRPKWGWKRLSEIVHEMELLAGEDLPFRAKVFWLPAGTVFLPMAAVEPPGILPIGMALGEESERCEDDELAPRNGLGRLEQRECLVLVEMFNHVEQENRING